MKSHRALTITLLLTLAIAGSSLAQPLFSGDKKDKKDEQKKTEPQKTGEQKKSDQEPAPLFEGKMNLKSSRQGKDSATLGFNGVGPNGEIEQKILDATPTGTDMQKANEMSTRKVAPDALQLFILEGQLNPQPVPKTAK